MEDKYLHTVLSFSKINPLFPVYSIKNNKCSCSNNSCSSPGKHPMTKNGFKDAISGEDQIRQLCQRFPNSNWGMITGKGIFVIDVDPKNGGFETFNSIISNFGDMPKTLKINTGGGGFHLYYKYKNEKFLKSFVIPGGIDIKAEGGYVVIPPSNHISGKTYLVEQETNDVIDIISEAPEELIVFLSNYKIKVQEGARNKTLFKAGIELSNRGVLESDLFEYLQKANNLFCEVPLEKKEVKTITDSVLKYKAFPDLKMPQTNTVKAPSLDQSLIPEPFKDWVIEHSLRLCVPYECILVPLLISISSLIGKKTKIKVSDSWSTYANLWGVLIAPPGFKKSPCISTGISFLSELENKAQGEFEIRKEDLKKELKKIKREIEILGKSEKSSEQRRELLKKKDELCEPVHKRFLVNNSTEEQLGLTLKNNPSGIMLYFDEIGGLFNSFNRKGYESYRSYLLQCWDGTAILNHERIGRESVYLNGPCVSLFGGIQPSIIRNLFRQEFSGDSGDGFINRFSLMIYPELIPYVPYKNKTITDTKIKQIRNIFEIISDEIKLKFHLKHMESNIEYVLSEAANSLFTEWNISNENRIRNANEEISIFVSHISKYSKLILSLSLIFQIIYDCDSVVPSNKLEISVDSVNKAIQYAKFFEGHAVKVFYGKCNDDLSLEALITKIKDGGVYDGMTVRELIRRKWSQLSNSDTVIENLNFLAELGWLRIESGQYSRAGRQAKYIKINPLLSNFLLRQNTDKTDKTLDFV